MELYLSTAYLPPLSHYAAMLAADRVCIDAHEHYQKQSYRNRCVIASPQGALSLSIPVERPSRTSFAIRDVRLSDHGQWQHQHWHALRSAYNSSPFFEYYEEAMAPFYHERRFTFLFDYNEALRTLLHEELGITPTLVYTETYRPLLPEGCYDGRMSLQPKCDADSSVWLSTVPYYQVFADKLGFLPNMSVVDLLFHCGPEARLYLKRCADVWLGRDRSLAKDQAG